MSCLYLNHDPLDLIEADLVAPPVVELRGTRRRMVSHRRGLFERAAVLQVGGDPGRSKTVVPELCVDPGRGGAPTDHGIGVGLRQHGARENAGAAPDRAE